MTLTLEDHHNIDKWINATSMMIEGKLRTDWTKSERKTFEKLNEMKREAQG